MRTSVRRGLLPLPEPAPGRARALPDLKVKPNPRRGVCRMIENGEGCTERVVLRGMCRRHYG